MYSISTRELRSAFTVCLWNTDTNKLFRHMRNGSRQTMAYKSLPISFISMDCAKYTEIWVPHSQTPTYCCNFSDKYIQNRDKFCQSGYYPRKVAPVSIISYLGSDQQDHLDQHFVSNWPLANTEWRGRTQQAIIPVGIGRYNLSHFEKIFFKKPKAAKYVNSGVC